MSKIIVNSKSVLNGTVNISGSKNAGLPILAACILTDGLCVIESVPDLSDIDIMIEMLEKLGCVVTRVNDKLNIDSSKIINADIPFELAGKIRASFLFAGALTARFGYACVALPGGCAIGSRPVDLHLKGFELLGAQCSIKDGYAHIKCKKPVGTKIYLDFPSVGATQNIIMASVFAENETVIENCASEPEIVDLINFLNKCGADISGGGTDKITVKGVKKLHGCNYRIIPDRIEAGTFMIGAALTRGKLHLKNVECSHLCAVSAKLSEIGANIEEYSSELTIECNNINKSTDIKTMPFPGFPTDMQSQFAALMCNCTGTSVITETVFENRFMYIPELIRMDADIKIDGRTAVISGHGHLKGAEVKATDLRAGAALVLAALCADGKTVIGETQYIKRGYCDFTKKLKKLGADLTEE